MPWHVTFTFLCCCTAAGLFIPGAIMDYFPALATRAELYLRTSRAVGIVAMLAALIFSYHAMRTGG
jgi:hypothetical protein